MFWKKIVLAYIDYKNNCVFCDRSGCSLTERWWRKRAGSSPSCRKCGAAWWTGARPASWRPTGSRPISTADTSRGGWSMVRSRWCITIGSSRENLQPSLQHAFTSGLRIRFHFMLIRMQHFTNYLKQNLDLKNLIPEKELKSITDEFNFILFSLIFLKL